MHSPRSEWYRFIATAPATIANTVTETTQFPTGTGSLTLEPENLQAGMTYRIRLRGHVSTQNTVDTTIKVKLGSTVILSHTGNLAAGLDQTATDFDAEMRVCAAGINGQICMNGMTRTANKNGVGPINGRSLNAQAATVDLSTAKTLDVTYQWADADPNNTLTITHATVEVWS